jgi:hypothetical protein
MGKLTFCWGKKSRKKFAFSDNLHYTKRVEDDLYQLSKRRNTLDNFYPERISEEFL